MIFSPNQHDSWLYTSSAQEYDPACSPMLNNDPGRGRITVRVERRCLDDPRWVQVLIRHDRQGYRADGDQFDYWDNPPQPRLLASQLDTSSYASTRCLAFEMPGRQIWHAEQHSGCRSRSRPSAPGEPRHLHSVEGREGCACAPVQRARYETAASCAGVIASGWNGRSVVFVMTASGDLEAMPHQRTAVDGEATRSDATHGTTPSSPTPGGSGLTHLTRL